MNKYNLKYAKVEKMSTALNDFELSIMLINLKRQVKHLVDNKVDVDNHFVITFILVEYSTFSNETKKWCKKNIIDKINKNWLYEQFLMYCSNDLLNNESDSIMQIFKSFIELRLIDHAQIIDVEDHKVIEILIFTGDKVRFSHVPLEKELVDEYRGDCHAVTSTFMKKANINNTQKVVVALENNELIGKGYHSFIVDNDIMYDLAHNVIMKYNDYLKLVKPEVLVYEDSNMVLDKIKKGRLNFAELSTCP